MNANFWPDLAGGGLELAMAPHSFATLTVQRSRK